MEGSLLHVHVYSADAGVQAHWRHGLAGHCRLHVHDSWRSAHPVSGEIGLVDLHLPGLPALTEPALWNGACPPGLIACSALPRDDEGLAALRAGFRGYCNTWSSVDLLPRMVQAVAAGELWIGRSLLSRLLLAVAVQPQEAIGHGYDGRWRARLTERECEVAALVADGASNKEAARRLGVSERTIKDHLTHIFSKLHVHDRVQLALHVHGVDHHEAR